MEKLIAELLVFINQFQKIENISPHYMALILNELVAIKIRENFSQELMK